MKRVFQLVVIGALLITSLGQAQGARFGFKLGLNFSSISDIDFSAENIEGGPLAEIPDGVTGGRTNFTAVFFGEFTLNNFLSLQPELVYSTEGNNFDDIRFDALQLPIGLRVNFGTLYFIAGPQAGLKISDSQQSEDFRSFSFSAFGGVGYHITQNIFVSARYTFGFSELFEDDARVPIRVNVNPEPEINPVTGELEEVFSNEVDTSTQLFNLSGSSSYFTISIGYRI